MILSSKLRTIVNNTSRNYGSCKYKLQIKTDKEILNSIKENIYKPRNHPGIIKHKNIGVPESLLKSILHVVEDYPLKAIINDGKCLNRKLLGRMAPTEIEGIQQIRNDLYEEVLRRESLKIDLSKKEDDMQFKQKVQDKVTRLLKKNVYNWKPMNYDAYKSLVYLIGRVSPEYATLVKIFKEISERDTEFKPKCLFDFGSGVGTATWAANLFWKQSIFEYFNVDTSSFMNDLSEILLKGGRGIKETSLKGVFYRQFLPANNATYDLVISAYTLLELPSFQSRMDAILNLWNKTEKYLIIVEQGTKTGYRIVNEARDFILQIEDKSNQGHVFSPCPHDADCPRFFNDNNPCTFEISYVSLPVGEKSEIRKELYSYVVLKKGVRNENDLKWPRVVKETLIRSKHSICRVCTSNGTLEEIIFTAAKHGKETYHCARATKWGDRLPIVIEKLPSENKED